MRYLTLTVLALSLSFSTPVGAQSDDDSALVVDQPDDDPALVVAVPKTDDEALALISKTLDAANNGQWTIFAGLLILLLVFGLNRLGLAKKVGNKWVPWVTLWVGVITAVAIGLATGVPLGKAITAGLLEGGTAIALWELVVKHFTTKKADGRPRI